MCQTLIKGNLYSFATCYWLKMAPKVSNDSKFPKEQEMFAFCTIDGTNHQFNKNWWIRQKPPYIIKTYPQNISKNQNISLQQSCLKYVKMFLTTLYVLPLILTLFRLLLYNLHAMFGWFLPYKFCNTSGIHQGPNWFKLFRGLHWNWRYFFIF